MLTLIEDVMRTLGHKIDRSYWDCITMDVLKMFWSVRRRDQVFEKLCGVLLYIACNHLPVDDAAFGFHCVAGNLLNRLDSDVDVEVRHALLTLGNILESGNQFFRANTEATWLMMELKNCLAKDFETRVLAVKCALNWIHNLSEAEGQDYAMALYDPIMSVLQYALLRGKDSESIPEDYQKAFEARETATVEVFEMFVECINMTNDPWLFRMNFGNLRAHILPIAYSTTSKPIKFAAIEFLVLYLSEVDFRQWPKQLLPSLGLLWICSC